MYDMLQAAISGYPAGLRTCLAFVNAMLAFTIPRVDALLNSTGVAFEKSNRRGIRPIAICEAWLRLAAIVCIKLLPEAGPSLAPLQLRVSIRVKAKNIRHVTNAVLLSEPADTVVVSHDWEHSFNTIHWADLFAAVASRHPYPFTNLMYGAHSTVNVFCGTETGTVDIVSSRGVRQGNPLGPLLFAPVPQRQLEAVAAAHPGVHPIAYADDTYHIGPGPAVTAAFLTLVQPSAAMGLAPSLHKCAVFGTPLPQCTRLLNRQCAS
jgi:hypothetical protein